MGGKMIARKLENNENLGAALDKAEGDYLKAPQVPLYRSPGHVDDFLNCMRSRRKPITNEVVGSRSVIACHLMNLAYYHQKKIHWDPIRNRFADDSSNPAWLTREYRGDWNVA